jgi:transposase
MLLQVRTKLINHVRGYARRYAIVFGTRTPTTLPKLVRKALQEHPSGCPDHIEWLLTTLENINEQIALADAELEELASRDPLCVRLMSVPGVGPLISMRFAAVIDSPERFRSSHDVMSYLGLTPGENSSSQRKQRTGITKAGAADLRYALVQGAWAAMRCKHQDPMVRWALRVAQRRNKQVAAVALARKIAGILYAIWKTDATYEPNRAAIACDETNPT